MFKVKMDSEFLLQIENPNMERLLLRGENIPPLEELLNAEAQRFKKLQELKEQGKLNFGDKIKSDELRELFPKISAEVNGLLGVESIDTPSFGYYSLFRPGLNTTPIMLAYVISASIPIMAGTSMLINQNLERSSLIIAGMGALALIATAQTHWEMTKFIHYNPLSKFVNLKRDLRAKLIPSAGHEYTHHIQNLKVASGVLRKYYIFREGHARGVERHLSNDYREREDNEAFLYDILDTTVGELKSAYVWLCRKLGKPVRKNLLKTKSSSGEAGSLVGLISIKPSPHSIGNTLFSLYEAQYGKRIYSDMIQGNFAFR